MGARSLFPAIKDIMPEKLHSTITDTALIFEGGGMRGSYTAALVNLLIREGIFLNHVSGISAGSSHTTNYMSRDAWRARAAFVDVADDPNFCGASHFLRGHGYFNAEYIYQHTGLPDGTLPLDMETFHANPATMRIGVFDATANKQLWLGKEDMPTYTEVARVIRGSSTLPLLMPPQVVDGHVWVDGALGPNGGIALDAAMRDGYRKYLIVLTRPRDYVKGPLRPSVGAALRAAFPRLPSIYEAVAQRPSRYNAVRRHIQALEDAGRAYVFYPREMNVSGTEMRRDRLEASYEAGMRQAEEELPAIKDFLGL